MAFTTNPFADGDFCLGGKKKESPAPDAVAPRNNHFIVSDKAWANYCDEAVYEFEKALRDFFELEVQNPDWQRLHGWRKFTIGMLWRSLYGRDYDRKKDSKYLAKISKVCAYYCTRIQDSGYYGPRGPEKKGKTTYCFMTDPLSKKPYSLKLRIEWLNAQGIPMDRWNMMVPRDDLKPGHARRTKTERNMQLRKEKARRAYNEYQRERNARIEQGEWVVNSRRLPDDTVPGQDDGADLREQGQSS